MDSIFIEFVDYVCEILDIEENDEFNRNMITNFLQIIEHNQKFSISLDDIVKWLDVSPHGIRTTLERSYQLGIDYVSNVVHSKNGRHKYDIYISNDCFKQLCLKTKSKHGDLIRKYFIIVEKMYREYMLSSILHRQRIDGYDYEEKKYRPTKFPIGNCVYIIRIVNNTKISYKIGFTNNVNRRLSEHRRKIPGKLEVVLFEMFEHHKFLESCVHSCLSEYNRPTLSKNGSKLTEIFETDIDKIKQLIIECRGFRESPRILAISAK